MHEVDSWFDLDVRIDEPMRRPSLAIGSFTTDFTVGLTGLADRTVQSDEGGHARS